MNDPHPCGTAASYRRMRKRAAEGLDTCGANGPCDACRAAWRAYMRPLQRARRDIRYMPWLIDADETVDHVRWLVDVKGVCLVDVGVEAGIGKHTLTELYQGRRKRVSRQLAARVLAVGTHRVRRRWARHYDECVVCGGRDSRHHGHGVCNRCRQKRRKAGDLRQAA